MKRRLFNVVVLVSVVIAGILLCGYLVSAFAYLTYSDASGHGAVATQFDLSLRAGGAAADWVTLAPAPAGTPAGPHIGWNERYWPIWSLGIDRALWGFAVGSVTPRYTYPTTGTVTVHQINCPIWFLEAMCLIAPMKWLRAHRRRGTRGFPVIRPDQPDQ
jgi:hypothetical protein